MRTIKVFVVLTVIGLFSFACAKEVDKTIQAEIDPTADQSQFVSSIDEGSALRTIPDKTLSRDKRPSYLGCWSGADRNATVFQFSYITVRTSINKTQSILYEEIAEDPENDSYILKLKEIDENNYLQKYLKISLIKDGNFDGIQVEKFDSPENIKDNSYSGKIKLFKDDCNAVSQRFGTV